MSDSPRLPRRTVLGILGGVALTACAPDARGDHDEPVRYTYGDHPSQFAEITTPSGDAPAPVVVVIHGGYWSSGYGLELGRPLALDLADRGFAAVNVEYRRMGEGGGWPQTGQDVAAAVDALADRPEQLDLSHVVAVGHSAGGQLAGRLASRGSSARVPLTGAVLQAGVLDLVTGADGGLGGGAVQAYLGGTPQQVPQMYADASPIAHVPLGLPTVCVHGAADALVPLDQSRRFVDAARRAGDSAELQTFDGDHFAPITVGTRAWDLCVQAVQQLTR